MKHYGRLIVILGCVVVMALPAQAERLRYKGKAGDRYVWGVGVAMNNTIRMANQDHNMPMKMTMRMEVEVVKADAESLTLRYKVQTPMMELNGQEMPAPVGQSPPFLVTMGRDGKVTKVEAEGEQQGDPSIPQGLQLNFGDTMNQAFLFFPDRDLKKGDTWRNEGEVPTPVGGTIKVSSKSTFAGVEEVDGIRCAKITTNFSMPLLMPFGQGAGEGRLGSLEGAIKGDTVTYFDLEAGQIHRSEMTGKAQMAMGGSADSEGSGREVSVKMASNIRSTMKRLEE